ncbi:MAG: SEC-C metal-binding domain-containing protein [Defluviitaleaceae bacterium]|nr:SEC-C metal-binding domain-containing protein [Defluviitaleaceae bacterium]
MTLYEEWTNKSQGEQGFSAEAFWKTYLPREQVIYEYLLDNKQNKIKTTISEFAKTHNMQEFEVVGFFDGISEALNEEISMEDAKSDTEIEISFEFESLLKKMVEYKAEHLYTLKSWENIFDLDKQKSLIKEQKLSTTVVKDKKISRNDPCPCDSGKKYKKCCGLND